MPAFIECDLLVMLCSLPLVCKTSKRTEGTTQWDKLLLQPRMTVCCCLHTRATGLCAVCCMKFALLRKVNHNLEFRDRTRVVNACAVCEP